MLGNPLALFAMVAWLPATIFFFMRFRPAVAAPVSIFGAGMLLPYAFVFDFTGLPPMDREAYC